MGRPTRSYLCSIASQMDPLDTSSMCTCTAAPLPECSCLEFKPYAPPLEEYSVLSDYYNSHFHNHPCSHSRSYLRSVDPVEDLSYLNGQHPAVPFVDSDYDSEDDPYDPDDPDIVVERVLDPVLNRYAMLAREFIGVIRSRDGSEPGIYGNGSAGNTVERMETDNDEEDEQDENEEDQESGGMDARVEYHITFSPAPQPMFESSRNRLPTRLDQLPTLSAGSFSALSPDESDLPRLDAPYTFSAFLTEGEEGDNDGDGNDDSSDGPDSDFD